MSLLLPSHPLSLPTTTPFSHSHRAHLHPHPKRTLLFPINPPKTLIYAAAKPGPETLPKSAIQRIADKLRSLGYVEENPSPQTQENNTQLAENADCDVSTSKIGEIFIPNSRQIPNFRVGHTLDPSWSTPQNPVPEPGSGSAVVRMNELSVVVNKERREGGSGKSGEGKVPTLAELAIPGSELRRLRGIGIQMKQKMKVGKAGITEGVVNGIHERWRSFEVVKIVCEDISRLNMKRTHDLLEIKTGGMVIWRAGSKIILYRGANYKYPYFSLDEVSSESRQNAINIDEAQSIEKSQSSEANLIDSSVHGSKTKTGQTSLVPGVGSPNRVRFQLPGENQLVEEADKLLEGLGPRFTDWWGFEPLPIDADLLPPVVPGYRKPFRLLPYGVKPKLTNDEMTILKRLGRPLPCHFALGRNRNHQGLAVAILKLWEKCEIAKIAVKRGVQNTNSELMAEEIKRLTGGLLLSRDKEYIVFYRGKDFLPAAVSSAIQERQKSRMQESKHLGIGLVTTAENTISDTDGRASDSVSVTAYKQRANIGSEERKIRSLETAVMRTNRKLSMVLEEKAKAEKLISELEQAEISQLGEVDKEGITEEERYMLRRVGLKMKPFLLLGRRGVFDGTIENMHLHWKYRELVKIICGGWNINEIQRVARTLEAESGGILVAVERVRKGHAIIVYRGKNYQRPACLRPQTLLNKKEALKRSIEAQRRESLKLNVLKLSRNIEELKLKLVKDKEGLDSRSGDQLKPQLEVEELELNSPDSLSSVREETSNDTAVAADTLLIRSGSSGTSSDTLWKEQIDPVVDHSLLDDLTESSCSEIAHSPFSDSGNTSHNQPAVYSSSTESEPVVIQDSDSRAPFLHTSAEEAESNSTAARSLTNKERLLLRKQALKMKRRPVLAVGRSNVVTGVAKAIKDHFKKHPLAIVNVKGRAKGTSVREVVFQLEQETGGILVSQEPTKVILYRGWGSGIENGSGVGSKEDRDKRARVPSVSPELMAAIRVECGLPSK